MKPTGIVRRIDDLGRVVIPKEVRHMLLIEEGDPLEIFVGDDNDDKDGYIKLKKYVPNYDFTNMVDDLERRFVNATDIAGHKNSKDIKQRFEEIKKLWMDC